MTSLKFRIAVAAAGLLAFNLAWADVWMWVDQLGQTRFVETMRPMYTWVADDGKVVFSDTPDHETAILVQLVWHSSGSIADLGDDPETDPAILLAAESVEEREKRRQAEARYCQRVTEIHDSYVNAPKMYRTNDKGEREYLRKYEVRRAIREISTVMKEACSKVD